MDERRGFRVAVARGRPLAEEKATAACTIYGFNFNRARGRGGKRKERKRRSFPGHRHVGIIVGSVASRATGADAIRRLPWRRARQVLDVHIFLVLVDGRLQGRLARTAVQRAPKDDGDENHGAPEGVRRAHCERE